MTTLAHTQARRALQAAVDESLSAAERADLEQHLQACPECRAYAAELDRLHQALSRALYLPPTRPSASARDNAIRTYLRRNTMQSWLRTSIGTLAQVGALAVAMAIFIWFIANPAAQPVGVAIPSATASATSFPTVSTTSTVVLAPASSATSTSTPAPTALATATALPSVAATAEAGIFPAGLIAFESRQDGNSEIYVMQADGRGATNLTHHPANDFAPRWSPDGKRLAFLSFRNDAVDVFAINADGTGEIQLTSGLPVFGPHSIDWSPDGAYLIVETRSGNAATLWVVNTDGSGRTPAAAGRSFNSAALLPQWLPGSQQLLISVYHNSTLNPDIIEISAVGTATVKRTDTPTIGEWNFALAPAGAHLAYFASDQRLDGSAQTRLQVMSLDGSSPTTLLELNTGIDNPLWLDNLTWSPDGTRLFFTYDHEQGKREFYILQADGSKATHLPLCCPFGWSPDSQWILFSDASGLFALNAESALASPSPLQKQLLSGTHSSPVWQPIPPK